MDATKAYKNRIAQRLTTILIDAYEQQALDRHEISILATYIREEFLHKQFTDAQIFRFVEELAHEVPLFASLLADPQQQPVKNVNRHFLEQVAK
ncbi:MAG: hypothetical protein ACR2LN_04035 [Candidatus Levyibacteriota bacterium]